MNSRRIEDADSGQLVPDSPEAIMLGYSSSMFEGHLWRVGGAIYIWKIRSKEPGKGHLSALVQKILDSGYTVKVPTPVGRMAEIVRHMGFTRTVEYDPELQPYEVWIKEPGPVSTPFFDFSPTADEHVTPD